MEVPDFPHSVHIEELVGSPQDQKAVWEAPPQNWKIPQEIFNVYRNSVSIKYLIYLTWNDWKCHSLSKITTEKQPKCLNICQQHHPDNLWSHISHSSRGLGSGESNLLSCRPTGSIFSDWRIGKAWWHTENKSFQWCLFQRKIIIIIIIN